MIKAKIISLQWWYDDNYISDEYGRVVYNPYKYVSPNDLFLFKTKRQLRMIVPSVRSRFELIELQMVGK